MPRIRTIKPEFFLHEELFDLELETNLPIRVAYAGLWCHADREGRFKWKPRTLKAGILPYDSLDFSRVLDALARVGILEKYIIGGVEYGSIPSFSVHQVINNREAKSSLPPNPNVEYLEHLYSGVNVPGSVFQIVSDRDGGKCVKCGSIADLTIDHVIPQSIEYNNTLENLRILCRSCNSKRPVAGQGMWDDINEWFGSIGMLEYAKRRVPTRDQSRLGEGKGKEGKGKEGERKENTCSNPTDSERSNYPKGFLDWYEQYPKKKAKGDALKAWKKAIKLISPEKLIEATVAYSKSDEAKDMQFVPYPATWLNAGRYEDDPETWKKNKGANNGRQTTDGGGLVRKTDWSGFDKPRVAENGM